MAKALHSKAYLSGPMSGIPGFNFPAFNEAAAELAAQGYDVFNPASEGWGDGDPSNGFTTEEQWREFLRHDIAAVAAADTVFVLPGWEQSKGATFELSVAHKLGIPVYDFETAKLVAPPVETVCQEADRLVAVDRQHDYGHPLDDFTKVVGMVNALFADKLREPLVAEDWPLIMECVKMSRERSRPKRDNRVDGCGYWKTLDLVHEERERRAGAPIPPA